ncbi:conserved hypothetical protein [Vibrio crassostreae]|nr:conserved hypothetical protein [Vibrio crassostreae]
MSKDEMKRWIDNASYQELLRKNRFAPVGDPFFQGDIGEYYLKVMGDKRIEIGNDSHVAASKAIGW